MYCECVPTSQNTDVPKQKRSQSGLRRQGVTPRKGLNFLGHLWTPRQNADVLLIIKENAV